MAKPSTSLYASLTLLGALSWLTACGGSTENGSSTAPPPATEPTDQAVSQPGPEATGPTGSSSIVGKVTFEGTAPRLKPISMDADPACASKHDEPVAPEMLVLGEGQSLGNVFVQVKNPPEGSYPPPAEAAIIDQRGCLYVPHVLGVLAGQTLQFRNSDGILHNVHGLPKENREFNIGMPPAVTETDTTLTRPEPVFPVKCDVHPWMRSFVAVMSHPFFAVSDTTGTFQIENLPAGTWEIEAWHERLGFQEGSITVGDGETGSVDFTFAAPSGG